MPYLTCESCGLSSFAVRGGLTVAECPGCGARLSGSGEARSSGLRRRSGGIEGTLTLARDMLSMDVAMVSEITEVQEIARHVSGEWPGGELEGRALPLRETFCARMIAGTLSNLVCDARTDERVNDLAMVRALGVGAWIGVPMQAAHARLYVLCCLAAEARPHLQQRDVYALAAISDTLLDQLERSAR